jgi:hypothetical protein
MEPNMGATDRIVRAVLALAMIGVNFLGILPGWLGLTMMILGLVFLTTAIVGYCPLYWPFGLSTRKSSS